MRFRAPRARWSCCLTRRSAQMCRSRAPTRRLTRPPRNRLSLGLAVDLAMHQPRPSRQSQILTLGTESRRGLVGRPGSVRRPLARAAPREGTPARSAAPCSPCLSDSRDCAPRRHPRCRYPSRPTGRSNSHQQCVYGVSASPGRRAAERSHRGHRPRRRRSRSVPRRRDPAGTEASHTPGTPQVQSRPTAPTVGRCS